MTGNIIKNIAGVDHTTVQYTTNLELNSNDCINVKFKHTRNSHNILSYDVLGASGVVYAGLPGHDVSTNYNYNYIKTTASQVYLHKVVEIFTGTCSSNDNCGTCGSTNFDGKTAKCDGTLIALNPSTSCTFCLDNSPECCTGMTCSNIDGFGTKHRCPAKFSMKNGQISCAGTTSTECTDATCCEPCSIGKYNDVNGQMACKLCHPGQYTNQTEQASCQSMLTVASCGPGQGFLSSSGDALNFQSSADDGTCVACGAGTFSSVTSLAICDVCPPGRFQNETGKDFCVDCPAGKTLKVANTFEYHDELSDCEDCRVLQFMPFTGSVRDCYLCLTATVLGSTKCDGCDPGRYKITEIDVYGNLTDECYICASGYFTEKQNLPVCSSCPRGWFANEIPSNAGEIIFDKCSPCPRGKFGNFFEPRTNESVSCNNCTKGTYSDLEGGLSCSDCPAGKWNENVGLMAGGLCKLCGECSLSLFCCFVVFGR
jgi:hypothetical protein